MTDTAEDCFSVEVDDDDDEEVPVPDDDAKAGVCGVEECLEVEA